MSDSKPLFMLKGLCKSSDGQNIQVSCCSLKNDILKGHRATGRAHSNHKVTDGSTDSFLLSGLEQLIVKIPIKVKMTFHSECFSRDHS